MGAIGPFEKGKSGASKNEKERVILILRVETES